MIATGPAWGGSCQVAYSKPAEPCVVTGVERDVIVRGAKSGWDLVVRELDHLQLLRDNWDGDGSKAPSLATVGRAVRTAELLAAHGYPAPTTATATRAGGILITWEDDPAYREIEIVGPERIEWMTIGPDQKAEHGEISLPPFSKSTGNQ